MANFNDFDLEVQDLADSTPEHFEGTVTTAGSPITITPTNSKPIQLAFINVQGVRDPNPNGINDAIYITIDGSSNKISFMSGESQYIPGVFNSLKVDSNNNGTSYQIIVWS